MHAHELPLARRSHAFREVFGAAMTSEAAGAVKPPVVDVTLLRLMLRAEEPVHLSAYVATTVRGAVGRSLREQSCTTGAADCDGCPRLQSCPFGMLWMGGAAGPDAPTRLRNSPLRPYCVDAPIPGAPVRLPPGELIPVEILLYGGARSTWPSLVSAAANAAECGLGAGNGRARLVAAELRGGDATVQSAYSEAGGLEPDFAELPGWRCSVDDAPGPLRDIGLRLQTPLRLNKRPERSTELDMPLLVRSLARRLIGLHDLWAPHASKWSYSTLIEDARSIRLLEADLEWVEFERYSDVQGRRIPMAGLIGSATLGDSTPAVLSLLRIGALIRAGRETTRGFGNISVHRPRTSG